MAGKGFIGEFKEFISRGNVMDMAVGVIIGGAFSTIVNSLVEDVITPLIGLIGGSQDFSSLKIGPVMIGNFINAVVDFLIIALVPILFSVLFLLVSPVASPRYILPMMFTAPLQLGWAWYAMRQM